MKRYTFFTNSVTTWEAMFGAILGAKESVYLEMYIFLDDTDGFDFLKLLTEKARSGVRVRIVLDSYGSSGLRKESIATLRNAGAEVYFFSRLLHRIHRKILVVDERVAFIGGVNFHQIARRWDDLAVQVKGKLVLTIIKSFAKIYVECGGKDPVIVAQNKRIVLDKTRTWLVEQFPARNEAGLKNVYKKHIREANKTIILVTPYFMPKRWFIKIIHQAVLRGVTVEVLVPRVTNHFFVDRIGYFFMFKLRKLGVDFYLEPKMNHAKVMIIDGTEGVVGSQNLDFFSFELNGEVGIFFKDQSTIGKLTEIVAEWKKSAILFDPKAYKPQLLDYFLFPFIRIFFRII